MPEINILQILFNSIVSGSLYILVALGLTMTYTLTKFPNFSHAELITIGAYIVYAATEQLGMGIISGVMLAFIVSGLVGVGSFLLVFRPLEKRKATMVQLMISSIGVGIVLRYLIQQIWGGQDLRFTTLEFTAFNVGPVRMTMLWVVIIITGVLLVVIIHLLLTQTKVGKAMRATAANPGLAQSCGIDIDKITALVWFIGAALAGVGGFFKAADTKLVPVLGWSVLLPAFAVIVLGGIGSFYGMIAGAYIIGLAENFSVIPLLSLGLSTDYKTAVGFIVIILILIFSPSGLAGIDWGRIFKRKKHRGET